MRSSLLADKDFNNDQSNRSLSVRTTAVTRFQRSQHLHMDKGSHLRPISGLIGSASIHPNGGTTAN